MPDVESLNRTPSAYPIIRMRVEFVMPDRSGDYCIARSLDDTNFTLSEYSRLGGVRIERNVSQPRALKADGSLDLSIFAFYPRNRADKAKWIVGSEVILEE